MMNYLKSLVLGGPKAEDKASNLTDNDISKIFTADDFEEIITTSLEDIVTLYELVPLQKPLSGDIVQKRVSL
jgi:hypothetical protein